MKTFLKVVGILLFFTILSGASYLVLNLSIKSSILVGISILVLCLFLFATSIYGLVTGKVKLVKLQNRIEVTAVLVGSILLALSISLFTLMNTILEYALEEEGVESKDKTRLLASTFFHIPTQRNLEKETKNGITYLYPSGAKETVEQIDALIQEKKSTFDALFDNEKMDPLTIEIYNDISTLRNTPLSGDVDGYYNSFNQFIHVVKIDPSILDDWEPYVLHEYTHYRSQQFSKENRLSAHVEQVPLWFEEGISEYMGYQHSYVDYILEDIADFHSLDADDGFHSAREDYDPYLQSYYAVLALVNVHGTEIIPELLLSESLESFYIKLEEKTGRNLIDFQQTFLEEVELVHKQQEERIELVDNAINAKKFSEAEKMLNEIKKYDIDFANNRLVEIYITQALYDKAIALLENEVINKDNDMYLSDVMQLAEIYLLFDTEKALNYAEIVQREAGDNPLFYIERTDKFIEVLREINSGDSVDGYKTLFDEELIYNDQIRTELHNKLMEDYPSQF